MEKQGAAPGVRRRLTSAPGTVPRLPEARNSLGLAPSFHPTQKAPKKAVSVILLPI